MIKERLFLYTPIDAPIYFRKIQVKEYAIDSQNFFCVNFKPLTLTKISFKHLYDVSIESNLVHNYSIYLSILPKIHH